MVVVSWFRYAPLGVGSIVRRRTPLGTATVPRPRPAHQVLGDLAERAGPDAELGERGAGEGAPPGDGSLSPRERGVPAGRA